MCEPLIGKKTEDDFDGYVDENTPFKVELDDLKSAVKGLIKYHENIIEHMIDVMETTDYTGHEIIRYKDQRTIEHEYKNINVIEHWLEDALEVEEK